MCLFGSNDFSLIFNTLIDCKWGQQLRCIYNVFYVVSQVVGTSVAKTKLQISETRIFFHYNTSLSQTHLMIYIIKYKIIQLVYYVAYGNMTRLIVCLTGMGLGMTHMALLSTFYRMSQIRSHDF